jgi:hypothetical protein
MRSGTSSTSPTGKAPKIVGLANGRCDQENVIEQLKSVNATDAGERLLSNWAYMVMTALAWNLRGLGCCPTERGIDLDGVLPADSSCQIVRTARRIIYRSLGYNGWLPPSTGKTTPLYWLNHLSKGTSRCAQNTPREQYCASESKGDFTSTAATGGTVQGTERFGVNCPTRAD